MTRAPEREYAAADQALFALERLELTDRDRLELSGRWFGFADGGSFARR